MQGLVFDGFIPNNDFQEAVKLLNNLGWNFHWEQVESKWWLLGGDQPVYVADNLSEIEAFIYGLALGYLTLPEHLLQQFKQIVEEESKDWL